MRLRSARVIALAILGPALLNGCIAPTSPGWDDLPPGYAVPLALLSGSVFPDLVVEVHYEEGYEPSTYALSELRLALENLTDKRNIVIHDPKSFPPTTPPGGVWSSKQLHDLADRLYGSGPCCALAVGNHGVLQIIYVGGRYEGSWQGLSSGATIWIFGGEVGTRGLSVPPIVEQLSERYVLLHEVGHSLGLVENPIEMQRPRLYGQTSPHHSNNPDSIMFGENQLIPESPKDLLSELWFDADDLEDLRVFKDTIARIAREDPQRLDHLKDSALRP